MNTLEQFFSPALTRALGWTLLHSLWQGALLAAVLAGALLLLRRQRAQVRYLVSAGALGALVLVVGLTFAKYYTQPVAEISTAAVSFASAEPGVAAGAVEKQNDALAQAAYSAPMATLAGMRLTERGTMPNWLRTGLRYFDRNMPLLVLCWLLGLLAMSLRMLGGLLYVQRLRRYRVRPLGAAWQARLTALTERAGLRRPVALLESALVRVPVVLGHARPVILLPLGAVAGLSPACLEAILAHELAHVLRRDYLVNMLQTVAEVLFFYHPAVWFMANCLRTERENCCDDTATALVGGNPLRLAHALTALAEWSQSAVVPAAPRLALAAMGSRGSLLERVRRLVQHRPAAPTWGEGVVAAALVLVGLGLLGGSVALAGPTGLGLAMPGQLPASKTVVNGSQVQVASAADTDTSKRQTAAAVPRDSIKIVRKTVVVDENGERTVTHETTSGDEQMVDNATVRTRIIRRERPEPGTVIIKKDKKGRLTDLVVNGQHVDVSNGKGSKGRAGKEQVTVVTVPPAPPTPPHFSYDFSDDSDGNGPHKVEIRTREFGNDADSKMERKQDKNARKMEKSARSFVYVTPGPGRHGSNKEIHVNIDDAALNRLVEDAMVVGGEGLDLGLRAAAQGLEEARRGLESALRDPDLNGEARREIKRSLVELERDRADAARDHADEARDHADEQRERRQELQERIRESQEELRELDEARREGPGMMPLPPPRAPRAPRPPRAPHMGMAPLRPMPSLPPAPPRPPVVSSAKVSGLLRNDGLIGKNDKNFEFQLNDDGLKVNGKAQSAEMADKYRRLLDMPKTSKGSSGIKMTVNEHE